MLVRNVENLQELLWLDHSVAEQIIFCPSFLVCVTLYEPLSLDHYKSLQVKMLWSHW